MPVQARSGGDDVVAVLVLAAGAFIALRGIVFLLLPPDRLTNQTSARDSLYDVTGSQPHNIHFTAHGKSA